MNYSDAYPILLLPLTDTPGDVVVKLALCTKARGWEHEREYRLVNFPNASGQGRVFDGVFSWKSKQLAKLPAQHVVGVTVGASMPSDQIENLLRICHDRRPQIPVYRAARQRSQFALQFETIS